ncbi:MAG: hypothetical protein Q8L48_04745 [Archangium sp.]|nr:hypothetical protein [Archangium sp.]
MKFEERPAGLLRVSYAVADDLKKELQAPVLARLEEKRGKVVLIFDVADAVRSVPMDVPNFWLGVTARQELQLVGMGIVTRSIAVRVAARGFSLANTARGVPTTVETFTDLDAAASWAMALLAR